MPTDNATVSTDGERGGAAPTACWTCSRERATLALGPVEGSESPPQGRRPQALVASVLETFVTAVAFFLGGFTTLPQRTFLLGRRFEWVVDVQLAAVL